MSRMRTFRLDKLVRDEIVESTEAGGGKVDYVVLKDEELYQAMLDKLKEEIAEIRGAKDSDELAKKIADVRNLLTAIAELKKVSEKEIEEAGKKRTLKAGGFSKGHYIKTVTLPADDKWAEYYASQPDRFPEISDK